MLSEAEHLHFLSDATRLRILHLLAAEPLTVGELQGVLGLSQSSISGHLAKLKRNGYIHQLNEGSSHRYRLWDDLDAVQRRCWQAVSGLTADSPVRAADLDRLRALQADRGRTWVERVAGSLHREYVPGRSSESLLHALLPLLHLGRCLDIGAGDGSLVELLAPRSDLLVCAEPNASMVEAGRRRLTELGVTGADYRVCAGEELPFPDGDFDTVLALQSLQYMRDPAAALAEAWRVLATGGCLVVLTLARHDFAEAERYGHLHRGFTTEQLAAWLPAPAVPVCYRLNPEARPPGFAPLVCTTRKEP